MDWRVSADGPATPRRCRIALLPDCHVQPGCAAEPPRRPAKRLYGAARWLLETYVERFAAMEVDAVFLLGDTLDPADERELSWLRDLVSRSAVPVHAIIGNHEVYGGVSREEFHAALGMPPEGNQLVRVKGVPFLMLATVDQDDLAAGTPGLAWLEAALAAADPTEDLFCCAHFSLLLHPCVQGWNNDGMQVLWGADELLALLRRHPRVRAWIAGHKNVPSKVERDGVLHLLSPQLIQTPCGFRLLDIHPDGILSRVHGIEERALAALSDEVHRHDYEERLGRPEDRDFWWPWPERNS